MTIDEKQKKKKRKVTTGKKLADFILMKPGEEGVGVVE